MRVWLLVTNLHFITSERSTKILRSITKILIYLFKSSNYSTSLKKKHNKFHKNLKIMDILKLV